MNCLDCQWARIKIVESSAPSQFICTRNPPVAAPIPVPTPHGINVNVLTLWPTVTANDICGEYIPQMQVAN